MRQRAVKFLRNGESLIAIAVIAIAVVAIVFVVIFSLHSIPASKVFAVQAEMQKMADDESALHDWLNDQPGVIGRTIHTQRSDDGTTLTVTFMMSQNGWYFPPFPKLEMKCRELGYQFASANFVDVER